MLNINNFLSFFPYLINSKLDFFFKQISSLENLLISKKVKEIQKPIFICGFPRSGTTALLEILNNHEDTASFLYKDLPFVKTLFLWNLVSNIYYKGVQVRARYHGDGIKIGPESPDAFEELIWKDFIINYEKTGFFTLLSKDYNNNKFEKFYCNQIKKIMHIRGNKTRYLSKGNYNIFRVEYIKKIFPDAKIIICYRDPFESAVSSVNVHNNFLRLSKNNKYFNEILKYLCHFEFGKSRKPIDVKEFNLEKNNFDESYYYYLNQWYKIYSLATRYYINLTDVIFVNNQTMIENPKFINILSKKLNLSNKFTLSNFFKKKIKDETHNFENSDKLYNLYNKLNYMEKNTLLANE